MLIWTLNKKRCQLIIIKVTIRNQPDSILNRGYLKGKIIMENIAFNDYKSRNYKKDKYYASKKSSENSDLGR
jgi:hypothetical protein